MHEKVTWCVMGFVEIIHEKEKGVQFDAITEFKFSFHLSFLVRHSRLEIEIWKRGSASKKKNKAA